MSSRKNKPVYGKSQGAVSSEPARDSLSANRSSSGDIQGDKSANQVNHHHRKIDFRKYVLVRSLPRTLFRLSILSIVVHLLITHTAPGKYVAGSIVQKMIELKISTTKRASDIHPQELSKKRQKNADENFKDAHRRAGGKDED